VGRNRVVATLNSARLIEALPRVGRSSFTARHGAAASFRRILTAGHAPVASFRGVLATDRRVLTGDRRVLVAGCFGSAHRGFVAARYRGALAPSRTVNGLRDAALLLRERAARRQRAIRREAR